MEVKAKGNKLGTSEYIEDLIGDREKTVNEFDIEKAKGLSKEIEKQRKSEKKIRTLESVDKDLDVREQFLGLRHLRKGYQPIPYALKKQGQEVGKSTS